MRGNHYIYVPNGTYYFLGGSGVQIYYSSTLNGTYSQVGHADVGTPFSATNKSGYYRILGGDTTLSIYGLNNSSVNIVNDLPKVTIISNQNSTYSGNTISFSSSYKTVSTFFKPTIDTKITVSSNYSSNYFLHLKRSSTKDGSYSILYSFNLGSTTTYSGTLTSSYYYELNTIYPFTAYFKDTAGSAVQFVE